MPERTIQFETKENVQKLEDLGGLLPKVIEGINNAFGSEMPEEEINDALICTLLVLAQNQEEETVVGLGSINRLRASESPISKIEGFRAVDNLPDLNPAAIGFYLNGVIVTQEYQGSSVFLGLAKRCFDYILKEKAEFLVTFTQNPKVERGIQVMLDHGKSQGDLVNYQLHKKIFPGFYERRLTGYDLDTTGTSFAELDLKAGDCYFYTITLQYPEEQNES